MNKKGFTYIISATLIALILFVVFFSVENYTFKDQQTLYQRRILVMNDFVKAFNQDFERAMQISSFRTMIALEDHVATTSKYLNSTSNSFQETVYNGTIDGQKANMMDNSSIKDYIQRSNTIASELGLQLDANITSITLTQNDPWTIAVSMNVSLSINDTTGLAHWNYNKIYTSYIPIINLRDPIYSVSTKNRAANSIRTLNHSYFVSPTNNTDNLLEHINGTYYLASNIAPSFLMRFENNNSHSPQGIESIVDVKRLSDQDLDVDSNAIKIDFIYFNNLSGIKVCEVLEIPSSYRFVITTDRLDTYNISGLSYQTGSNCP
ncbi:MAG: hypothetical protein ACP5N2_05070 [Candidatus Nanoarchaeia archaeon]